MGRETERITYQNEGRKCNGGWRMNKMETRIREGREDRRRRCIQNKKEKRLKFNIPMSK